MVIFQNNQIDISDSIPTEGNCVVGDIIIKETKNGESK